MNKVILYTKNNCPQCDMTKMVLDGEGIEFNSINVEEDAEALAYVKEELGFSATPIIVAEGIEPFSGFQPEKLKGLK